MKKICCVTVKSRKKFKILNILYIWSNTSVPSSSADFGSNNNMIFKEEESMNNTINNFFLGGNKFMAEMHLRQSRLTDSVCGPFQNEEKIQRSKEAGDLEYIYQNELDKVGFQHDMAHEDNKYLAKRTASDKTLSYKAFDLKLQIIHNTMVDIKRFLLQ